LAPPDDSISLAAALDGWLSAIEPLTLDGWQSSQTWIFGHTARGRVCPYGTEYGNQGIFEQPRQLAAISGFYRAFGLQLARHGRERADHACCELEFLGFLCRKEAFAAETGDQASLQETQKAARLFLRDHLGRFASAFASLLQEHDPVGFYRELGRFLSTFLAHLCRHFDVPPGPAMLRLRPEDDGPAPMACGGSEELVQLRLPS